jgi:hypothetical protein
MNTRSSELLVLGITLSIYLTILRVKLGRDDHGTTVAIKKYKKETATLETLKHELGIMKQL